MNAASPVAGHDAQDGFRHEAMLYAGPGEFLQGTAAFIRDGIRADEPTLVVVSAEKIARLRTELAGDDTTQVQFADMADVGTNPARIIPAWRDFVDRQPGVRRLRGVGEPIWAGRSPAELVECQRHEELLNVAFEGGRGWTLLCPYDLESLDPATIDEARAGHPRVQERGGSTASERYRGTDVAARPFDRPLPEPPPAPFELTFDAHSLKAARDAVAELAAEAGFSAGRTADLVVVVNELTTNSVLHGGGGGSLRVWPDADVLICEIRDRGQLRDPLAGRERPTRDQEGGRGLWLANQICELVQVRTFATGTVVRTHTRRS